MDYDTYTKIWNFIDIDMDNNTKIWNFIDIDMDNNTTKIKIPITS